MGPGQELPGGASGRRPGSDPEVDVGLVDLGQGTLTGPQPDQQLDGGPYGPPGRGGAGGGADALGALTAAAQHLPGGEGVDDVAVLGVVDPDQLFGEPALRRASGSLRGGQDPGGDEQMAEMLARAGVDGVEGTVAAGDRAAEELGDQPERAGRLRQAEPAIPYDGTEVPLPPIDAIVDSPRPSGPPCSRRRRVSNAACPSWPPFGERRDPSLPLNDLSGSALGPSFH